MSCLLGMDLGTSSMQVVAFGVEGALQGSFRFEMNEDPMVTEKMAEAIRRFTVDTRKLQEIVESRFSA
jgi:transaldolase